MLLEKKPDLTLKNKKGQTAIDTTNSKIIIALFWHYLTGAEEAKNVNNTSKVELPPPTLEISRSQGLPKDLLKGIKIAEPEVAKVQSAKIKEKKAILVGPKPLLKTAVLITINCIGIKQIQWKSRDRRTWQASEMEQWQCLNG